MQLDHRQSQLVRKLAKEVSDDIETKPFDEAADRIEGLSIVLNLIGATEAAEMARSLLSLLRETKLSHVNLTKKLSQMLVSPEEDEPTAGESR